MENIISKETIERVLAYADYEYIDMSAGEEEEYIQYIYKNINGLEPVKIRCDEPPKLGTAEQWELVQKAVAGYTAIPDYAWYGRVLDLPTEFVKTQLRNKVDFREDFFFQFRRKLGC